MEFFEGKFRGGKLKQQTPPRRKDAIGAKPMNNPNPFVPQGSLLDQQSKRRSRLKLAVFCVLAVGVAGLSAILIQGCERKSDNNEVIQSSDTDTNIPAIPDTNLPPTSASNITAAVSIPTNQVIVPPPAPATTEYEVVKGDSFSKIAKKFGVTVKAIEAANPLVDSTKLKIKQKLVIPAPTSAPTMPGTTGVTGVTDTGGQFYTVKSGDTLTKIARQSGVTVKQLEAVNPGVDPNHIKVGQKLTIPAKADGPLPGLVIELHYVLYDDHPVIRKWVVIRNNGSSWLKLGQEIIELKPL